MAPRRPPTTPVIIRPVTDQAPLEPDTSADAIRERAGLLGPTPEQSEAFWREHEPHMLPSDDKP